MAHKIWVVVQLRNGGLHPMSREAVAAAQKMAGMVSGEVEAIAIGNDLSTAASELSGMNLATVRTVEHPALSSYTPGGFISTLSAAIGAHQPSMVVFPHSYQSVEFVPRLAQELGAALVPEVTAFRWEEGAWVWRRPVFAGKMQCEVKARRKGLIIATIQSGAYSADELEAGSAPVEKFDLSEEPTFDREILGVEEVAGEHVDLSQADAIVAVGRGIGDADKIAIVKELATALGAEVGASRPVIDNGWMDRDRQIGSSGQVVSPKLYVAVGISGAIQHLVGMKGSQVIVAINKDANAPIFSIADYGVVGDLFEVVPALAAAVAEAKEA
jgi:electron transfer flavoprotein alpha subunit